MRRYTVILSVPVEDGEDMPDRWDWRALIDTSRPAEVLGLTETPLLPEDAE